MNLFTRTNVVLLVITCLVILPEITARYHNPSSLRPETPASPHPRERSPPQHNTLPPSPKKYERYEGGMYYLPPNRV
ncbi:hypothetical protein CRYUN_Cryun22dG0056700 [Craigia yunnanensis]